MTMFHPSSEYLQKGLSVVPLRENGKCPAIKIKEFLERLPTMGELVHWFQHGTRLNIGIVTGSVSNLVVVDADTRDAANRFWKIAPTTAISRTRKGFHFLYQHPGDTVKSGVRVCEGTDLRADGGYIVAPPSTVDGHQYGWVEGFELEETKDLPVFNPAWIAKKNGMTTTTSSPIKSVQAYVMKIESIQGQNGSAGLVRAVAKCRDSGLSESECTVLLLEWNQTSVVNPPWSIPELTRAISRLYNSNRQAS
jgi:hypothetical protein